MDTPCQPGPAIDDAAGEPSDPPPDAAQRSAVLQGILAANYAYLRRRLLRQFDCPDLAGECLHDAWLRLGETPLRDDVHSPMAYIYRMACNIAIDRMRGSRALQSMAEPGALLDELVDRTPGPELIAEARSAVAAMDRAMARLPRRHRSVLVALRLDEMTRQEAAARFELSLRGVDTTLRQALDYCAERTGRQVLVGINAPRRALRSAAA